MSQVPVEYRLDELENELLERLRATTTFRNKAFSIYNAQDILSHSEAGVRYPLSGVAYEGMRRAGGDTSPSKVSRGSFSATMMTVSYSIIIALEYAPAGNTDTKKDAFALLDETRKAVHGFRGINSGRPWLLVAERPLDSEADHEDLSGVIFYGQLWETDVPLTGSFTES